MAETFNQELFDAMLRHQIGVLQFSGSVRNRVWALLDASESDLKLQIRRHAGRAGFGSRSQVRQLNRLLEALKATRVKSWNQVRSLWFEEMNALALAEPGFMVGVISASVPVEIGAILPEAEQLRNIVKSTPFMGKTLKGWAANVEASDLSRIEDQIKIGLIQNETVPQISRRIVGSVALNGRDGVTQATRRHAATITRTVTNGIAAEARRAYADKNRDLAPKELFLATLDSRTTPICRRFDGMLFAVGSGPRLPLHMNERSLRTPVLDGVVVGERPRRDFTQAQLVREYGKANGLNLKVPRGQTSKAARNVIPRGRKGDFDKFARQRMRELTGPAPAKLTYQKWMSTQSAQFQRDTLGPTRAKLFRDGDLTLDKFVLANGTELTLPQLAARNAAAFRRAGLDPAAFN